MIKYFLRVALAAYTIYQSDNFKSTKDHQRLYFGVQPASLATEEKDNMGGMHMTKMQIPTTLPKIGWVDHTCVSLALSLKKHKVTIFAVGICTIDSLHQMKLSLLLVTSSVLTLLTYPRILYSWFLHHSKCTGRWGPFIQICQPGTNAITFERDFWCTSALVFSTG